MAAWLEGWYAHCEKITFVCDNLPPHRRGLLRDLRVDAGVGAGPPPRVPLHAEYRALPERRAERTESAEAPMVARTAGRGSGGVATGDRGVGRRREPVPTGRGLATTVTDARCKPTSVHPQIVTWRITSCTRSPTAGRGRGQDPYCRTTLRRRGVAQHVGAGPMPLGPLG